MSITVLADENIPAVEHYLGATATVRSVNGRTLGRQQLQGIDALLVRSVTQVNAELLAGSGVRFVGTATSGFDHIDRKYLASNGIGFAYAPGSNANSVVEYVLAAVAAIDQTLERLLAGGSVGIIGYGVIGKALAVRLDALGIRYRVFDPWLDQAAIAHSASLMEVLECDVVSLHAELTREPPWPSMHMLGAAELAQLAPGTVLINASRGPVIDNAALLACLQKKRGFSVVLDVWEGEPEINTALLDQVALGSAHIAGYSLDGKIRATRMLSESLMEYMSLPSPPVQSPLPAVPAVSVPANLSHADIVRYLLHSCYDIWVDNALLREQMLRGDSGASRGQGFDLLRKQYRVRRELAGTVVQGKTLSGDQVSLIRALDCIFHCGGQLA